MKATRLALVMAAAALSGCALLPKLHHFAFSHVKPVPTVAATPPVNVDDRLYADAVSAIDQREYGVALDLLQAARDRNASDVRVLNAFGVVYDKMGRFDLSSRYYAQAEAIDPNSQIIRENLAYSAMLQGKLKPAAATAVLAAATPVVTSKGLIQVAPGVVRLPADAFLMASAVQLPTLTGHPLVLVNASGRSGVSDPVRTELVRLGWMVPETSERLAVARLQSEIDYAPTSLRAAEGLARTLPYKVILNPCTDGCEGVRLVLGVDAATWEPERWPGHSAAG